MEHVFVVIHIKPQKLRQSNRIQQHRSRRLDKNSHHVDRYSRLGVLDSKERRRKPTWYCVLGDRQLYCFLYVRNVYGEIHVPGLRKPKEKLLTIHQGHKIVQIPVDIA